MEVLSRRYDGSFVIQRNGWPYHVTADDPLFHAAQEAGADAPMDAPPPDPIPSPLALTPSQWGFFLDLSGFRDALDAALDAMPKASMHDRARWAGMRAVAYASASYQLDVTLALVGQVRGMGLPVTIPTDAEIEAAFTAAAAFQGAASILT